MSAMTSLISAAAGAGLMYVLDPEGGGRRRGTLAKLRGGLETASVHPLDSAHPPENGKITLSGAVARDEVARFIRRLRRICSTSGPIQPIFPGRASPSRHGLRAHR